ncbi:hypothetical protein [Actinocrispum wychmicini]|uniref:Uncharacterized protein n=1 Tax=Actinocrispum wychmicini TaxID=1213861 RepID=A0A4R2JI28_9PSEU|nr:hypothetical protein [Actinocrispum wychmicini]TCO53775.1 hypothetical protein EV192_110367 [Actinocrispum wychmicini]
MARRTASALALSALASASVVLAAPSASADLVTYCVGNGGAVTLPTDLFVPDGKSCSLKGTTITGNVQVGPGANLVIDGGTINGQVQIASNGYLDSSNTRIDGGVTLASGGFGTYLKSTRTSAVTVQPKGDASVEGFLFIDASTIDGNVSSNVGEVRLDKNTQVGGNVTSSNTYYTDVRDSFVDGTLSVLNNANGSVVCGGAVQGKATFAGNLVGVQLGPNGTLDSCASGGYFGRDVVISNTTGKATVDDTIINGQLQLSGNSPAAQVSANNRIRGGVVGDRTAAGSSAGLKAKAAPARPGTKDQTAQARLTDATAAANAAGDAHLG